MKGRSDQQREPIVRWVPHAIVVPVTLTVIIIWQGFKGSQWMLVAITFIWLGSFCSATNMNLADGFLAFVAMIFGIILAQYIEVAGKAIFVSTFLAWLLSAFEKRARSRPIFDEHRQPSRVKKEQ